MNRTMTKNICLVAAFFITAILAVLMMGNNAGATASAASAEFEFVVREVGDTDLSIEERNNLPDNTYALDIRLEIDGSITSPSLGWIITYDSVNFDILTEEIGEDTECLYSPWQAISYDTAVNTETHQASITGAGGSVTYTSDPYITLYFQKKTTNNDFNPLVHFEIDRFKSDGEDVDTTVPDFVRVAYKYILGDLNGDGIADADDASLLLAGLEDSNTIGIEKLYWVLYDENFPATVICFDQVDANQDGYIMEDDADDILSAYASGMFGNYTGDIGTVMVYYATVNM